MSESTIDSDLFPGGPPTAQTDIDKTFELYKMMVVSAEALVNRRQNVNTFFLTINGAVLTAVGLIVGQNEGQRIQALGVTVLAITGAVLAFAWRSLILSFGQLNTGKFAVINRIEHYLPASIYNAEWKALNEGKTPKIYRTFTSREIWIPLVFIALYVVTAGFAGTILVLSSL